MSPDTASIIIAASVSFGSFCARLFSRRNDRRSRERQSASNERVWKEVATIRESLERKGILTPNFASKSTPSMPLGPEDDTPPARGGPRKRW